MTRPRIALTIGDIAGIGPEVIAQACADSSVRGWCRPVVIGPGAVMSRAMDVAGVSLSIQSISSMEECDADDGFVLCLNPSSDDGDGVAPGEIDARAGRIAYESLTRAIELARAGEVDAIVTAPLNKAALHAAGHCYPGHTEILAEQCGVGSFAMMLYLPPGEAVASTHGLGVAHATLHTSIRSVPELLTPSRVEETIRLVHEFMRSVGCAAPRVGVCALNPHAGEDGLFGDEEAEIIAPAVAAAKSLGHHVTGPLPADTLLKRAAEGEFDGIAAMYHDQGHIALKLLGFHRAVNVTLGLPIVRTSPSHGTAFDIAWQGKANPAGMREAIRVAVLRAKANAGMSTA